ncbi:hypothetical protein BH20ACT2_BH20ACT2_09420 [soil metagenome]
MWLLGARGGIFRVADDARVQDLAPLEPRSPGVPNVFDLTGADGRLWSIDARSHDLRIIDASSGKRSSQPLPG